MSERKEDASEKCPHFTHAETLEHFRNAHNEMRKGFEALLPKEFVERRREARREVLKGIRGMIDDALQDLEKQEA